jgi:hypothetical protein
MTLWMVAMLPLAIVGLALVVLFREMASRTNAAEFDPAWLEDFSIVKYRPMLRLLSEDDYEFLASQAGYEVKIASQLRMERRKVFRAYLRNLVRDFNRLHNAAKIMALCSAQDRPDLAQALLKQQLTFTFAVAAVKVRLMLHTVGIGTVEVRNLLASVDHLRSEIGDLAPTAGQLA